MKHSREEESVYRFYLPDEVWWLVMSHRETAWCIQIGSNVCRSWAKIVSTGIKAITPRDMNYLERVGDLTIRRLPNLELLTIWGFTNKITPAGLATLTLLKSLKIRSTVPLHNLLKCCGKLTNLTRLGADGDVRIPYLPSLRVLSTRHNSIVDTSTIKQFTQLHTLKLRWCNSITSYAIENLSSLHTLVLYRSTVAWTNMFNKLVNLTSLSFRPVYMSAVCFTALTNLATLELHTTDWHFRNDDFNGLHSLTKLFVLGKSCTMDFSSFTSLRSLELRAVVTDVSSIYLLTNLVKLGVYDVMFFTKQSLNAFCSLRKLIVRELILERSVTNLDISHIQILSLYDSDRKKHEIGSYGAIPLEPYYS